MTGPDDPQYPQYPPQYRPQPHPAQPAAQPGGPAPAAGARGERTRRRPEPRLGVSLAGAGIALVIFGILVWGGDYVASGSGGAANGGGSHRVLGVVLSLAAVVAGYALVIRTRQGPAATAGVVAGALGVPVLLGFLTLGTDSEGLPLSLDAVVLLSILVWVVSYLAVPGTRGHTFLLAASTLSFWSYVLDKVEPKIFSPAGLFPPLSGFGGSDFAAPDISSVGATSLVLGLAYYAAAYGLDRAGRAGTATAFVIAGLPAIVVGVALLADDLGQLGTGVVTIVLGLVIGAYAARYGRRLTTWVDAAAVAFGVLLIVIKAVGDNAAAGGITLIVVGLLVVVVAAFAARLLGEPDDMASRASAAPPGP